jgi:hypothetical protein
MGSQTLRCILTVIAIFLAARPAVSGPAGRDSISHLAATATTIVVGSVQATFVEDTVNATIRIERVLKGSVRPGSTLSLVWTMPQSDSRGTSAGGQIATAKGHGLFFLRKAVGPGAWTLVTATGGDITWDDTYIHTPANVRQHLRTLAAASLPAHPSATDMVLLEIVISAEAGAPAPYDLIEEYRQTPSTVLAAAFVRFQNNANPALASLGIRGSIAAGDPAAITFVHQHYATLSLAFGWASIVQDIRIYYLNTAAQAILALGQTAADTSIGEDLRVAAAGALSRMHTRAALPYLADLLNDRNRTLQSFAAGGLASFANNVPIGSHEPAPGAWPYRTADTIAHIGFDPDNAAFWRTWWRQNRSALL